MDQWLLKKALKINPRVIKKHRKFQSSYKKHRLIALQLKVRLLIGEPTLHKPSEMCKNKTRIARKEENLLTFIYHWLLLKTLMTHLCTQYIFCVKYIYNISLAPSELKRSFCEKRERTKTKLLNSIFSNLFIKAVISKSTY
jgi:hypothetical protein